MATVLMVVGGCIATGAAVLNEYTGLPITVGSIILVVVTILLSMYGANLVRSASTVMTIFIIACLIAMVVLGLLLHKVILLETGKLNPLVMFHQ